eukprot:10167-Heterococcus_DN1.PRE.1
MRSRPLYTGPALDPYLPAQCAAQLRALYAVVHQECVQADTIKGMSYTVYAVELCAAQNMTQGTSMQKRCAALALSKQEAARESGYISVSFASSAGRTAMSSVMCCSDELQSD